MRGLRLWAALLVLALGPVGPAAAAELLPVVLPPVVLPQVALPPVALPPVTPPPSLTMPVPELHALADGTPVWLVARPELPLVHFSFIVGHGLLGAEDPAALALASTLTDEGLAAERSGGDRGLTAGAYGDAVSAESAEISLILTPAATRLEVDSLIGHEAASLKLAVDSVARPRLPRRALRTARRAAVHNAADAWLAPGRLHDLAVQRTLYGPHHPLGRVLGAAALRRVRRRSAAKALQRVLVQGPRALVVVGDTSWDQLQPVLQTALAGLPAAARAAVSVIDLAPPRAGPRHVLVDNPGSQRAFLSVMLPVAGLGDPDQAGLDLLSRALASEFDSRLSVALREERGWTYAVHGLLRLWPGHGLLEVRCAVDAQVAPAALVLIQRELERLVAEPPQGVELTRAVAAVRRDVTKALLSNRSLADLLASRAAFGLPPNAAAAEVDAAVRISAAQLAEVAHRQVHPEGAVWVITGDREIIEPLLYTAGMPLDAIRSGRSVMDAAAPLPL